MNVVFCTIACFYESDWKEVVRLMKMEKCDKTDISLNASLSAFNASGMILVKETETGDQNK